jgi:2-succinyl-5-enolpyruvyl-6-hydroxy-3-cyclohexene-1-carboxylate synthase
MERVKSQVATNFNLEKSMNIEWAECIVKELIKQGVRHFCIGYGNRSTALTLAAAHHPLAKTHTHFDERGLGFYAIGLAKALNEPVAIIVTSGTAVGNLYPAVMEASNDQIPLILLTADRPAELRDTGANQTVDQQKFFGSFVRSYFDLPTPEQHYPHYFLQSTIAHLVHRSTYPIIGPVHLNCMFREPFFDNKSFHHDSVPFSTQFITGKQTHDLNALNFLFEQFDLFDEGMILVGSKLHGDDLPHLLNFSKHFNFPILAEIHSNMRHSQHEAIIPYSTLCLKHMKRLDLSPPKLLIIFGEQLISKEYLELINNPLVECIIQVDPNPLKSDPTHKVHHRVVLDAKEFIDVTIQECTKKLLSNYFQKWNLASRKITQAVDQTLDGHENFSEPSIALTLSNLMTQDVSWFISNSMPIRYMNDFYYPEKARSTFFVNRGCSGIDGNVATAIGIEEGLQTPVIALLGDMATLHDLNSFSLLGKSQKIAFVILNNHGGGIFSKVQSVHQQDILEKFFQGKHTYQFKAISEMFELPYLKVESMDELSFGLSQFFDQKQSVILEVFVEISQGDAFLKELEAQIEQITSLQGVIKSYFF